MDKQRQFLQDNRREMSYRATTVLEGAGMIGLLSSADWRAAKAIAGICHVNRFLADLERRYPGSTGSAPTRKDTP
jgi:hypothetical protein